MRMQVQIGKVQVPCFLASVRVYMGTGAGLKMSHEFTHSQINATQLVILETFLHAFPCVLRLGPRSSVFVPRTPSVYGCDIWADCKGIPLAVTNKKQLYFLIPEMAGGDW